jgi:hypothetical protein
MRESRMQDTDLEIIWNVVVFAARCTKQAIAGPGCLVGGWGLGVARLVKGVSLRGCLVFGVCRHDGRRYEQCDRWRLCKKVEKTCTGERCCLCSRRHKVRAMRCR